MIFCLSILIFYDALITMETLIIFILVMEAS
jgi:hypothetical protein